MKILEYSDIVLWSRDERNKSSYSKRFKEIDKIIQKHPFLIVDTTDKDDKKYSAVNKTDLKTLLDNDTKQEFILYYEHYDEEEFFVLQTSEKILEIIPLGETIYETTCLNTFTRDYDKLMELAEFYEYLLEDYEDEDE